MRRVALLSVVFLCACAAADEGALDEARFSLDNCSVTNLTACDSAITTANEVLATDSTNIDAALVKSSALATRGSIDLLSIMSDLAQTTAEGGVDQATQKFKFIREALIGSTDIAYLRQAVSTLTDIEDAGSAPSAGETLYKDFYFQLGVLQVMESFIRPVQLAQPTADAAVTADATTAITDADAATIQNDFISADDNLINGGIESGDTGWDLVTVVRNNYCAVRNVNAANAGFSTAELRSLMRCQLNTIATIAALSDDNGDFPGTAIATCAEFTYTGCNNTNTTE